jgi:hypothetical protein
LENNGKKLFTEQEKYRVDNIINQSNGHQGLEVNVQRKEIRFGYQHLC